MVGSSSAPLAVQSATASTRDSLHPGQALNPDQAIVSTGGRYRFVYLRDGNLVLYDGATALWASNTAGRPVGWCIMQGDGNLVVYDLARHAVWASGTNGQAGSHLVMQDDGNAVIYRPDGRAVWDTKTPLPFGPTARGDTMRAGEVLNPDQSITSASGRYRLIYQLDGNLVLYDGTKALWASNTAGKPAGICIMQADGNLVLYARGSKAIWATGTNGRGGDRLAMQNDGNAVIYRPDGQPVWDTKTPLPFGPTPHGDTMRAGEALNPNQVITSASGRYRLINQFDGNLVLYDGAKALWASNTAGKPAGVCLMQGDGNLVLYARGGQAIWSSGTDGCPGSRAMVQDDGFAVIYGPTGLAVWDTNPVVLTGRIPDVDGWVEVTLNRSGQVRFRGHIHNGGVESFDFRVGVVVEGGGVSVGMAYRGHAGGWASSDSRDEDWDRNFKNLSVAITLSSLRGARLKVTCDKRGDVTGFLGDTLDFVAKWSIGSALPGLTLIALGVEAGSFVATGGFTAGARIINGTLWLLGPEGTLVSLACEGIAKLGSKERTISPEEYAMADSQVFRGTLPPREQIVITDSVGGSDRPFTFPRYDGKIAINVGSYRYDRLFEPNNQSCLIHELVHAWQLRNEYGRLRYIQEGVGARVCELRGGHPYDVPPSMPDFCSLGLEQQAQAVEDWFLRTMGVSDQAKVADAGYKYIEQNIRAGIG